MTEPDEYADLLAMLDQQAHAFTMILEMPSAPTTLEGVLALEGRERQLVMYGGAIVARAACAMVFYALTREPEHVARIVIWMQENESLFESFGLQRRTP